MTTDDKVDVRFPQKRTFWSVSDKSAKGGSLLGSDQLIELSIMRGLERSADRACAHK